MQLQSFRRFMALAIMAFLAIPVHAEGAADTALITSLQGDVGLATLQGRRPLQAFTKLKRGDILALANEARLQLVYFDSGRQELWQGGGRLEILGGESKAFGLPAAEIKMLPAILVKQIARTPALDSQGRGGVTRLRSIATPDALTKLENSYRQWRLEAARGDLNPELFLLAGLFEMRQFDRIEQVLKDLRQARPGDNEAGLVAVLYQKAVRNARESGHSD